MEFASLWGDEFSVEEKEITKKIIEKIKKPKEVKQSVEKQVKNKKITLEERLTLIRNEVLNVLGKQQNNVWVIKTKEDLHNYITKAIACGRIAVDTETNNSLDPITCKLMGACIYVPGEKQAYIPINHRDPVTQERLSWQLTEQDIKEEFQRFIDAKTSVIMHNGKFDYQVLKCTCGIEVVPSWDTMIAAFLIDENEFSHGLKQLYIKYINPDQEKYAIDHLFEGVEYADVDPEIFALYAATDALMTDKLYLYQLPIFLGNDFRKIYNLFNTVEMPLVQVIAEMELAGMEVCQPYAEKLSKKYHKKLDNIDIKLAEELAALQPKIEAWKLTTEATDKQKKKMSDKQYARAVEGSGFDESLWSKVNGVWYKVSKAKIEQLDEELTPNSLASPVQLGILLYDILKLPHVNKEKPYATGEDELKALKDKSNICSLMLKRRELVKLISTYIDNIPELAKRWPDGRVRTHFNQYGAATGRLSSSDPINFQNIPSHEKTIRMLFMAHEGYKIIGSDFSAQEPRLTAFYSQDENMINAYIEGRDLYSVIASMSFDRTYEDCLEFYPEGTKVILDGKEVIAGHKNIQNTEGKGYRTMAKSILLGLLYGRSAASIGEQIGKTPEEAQEIVNKFFKAFPKVKSWIDETIASCKKIGYVEDVAGRHRRLPDIQLPKFTIRYKDSKSSTALTDFNPFIGCSNRTGANKKFDSIRASLEKARGRKQIEQIKLDAEKEGIEVINNGGFISQAERQCVNARVQGGAATLTKCALIDIFNDQRLRKLGARLINTVHDEILIEAPTEVAEEAASYLTEDMINAAKRFVTNVPMSCDPYIVSGWYLDEYAATVQKEFKQLVEGDIKKNIAPVPPMQAFEMMCEERTESSRSQIYEIVQGFLPTMPNDVEIIHTL